VQRLLWRTRGIAEGYLEAYRRALVALPAAWKEFMQNPSNAGFSEMLHKLSLAYLPPGTFRMKWRLQHCVFLFLVCFFLLIGLYNVARVKRSLDIPYIITSKTVVVPPGYGASPIVPWYASTLFIELSRASSDGEEDEPVRSGWFDTLSREWRAFWRHVW
jgi:hypothetical protein